MGESMFSTYWYRVAKLKPVLRDSAVVSRHVYRGQPWYVVSTGLNSQNHRFNPAAYTLIGLMNGQLTVQEIWENACRLLADDAPTQDDVIRLLGRLHNADLIQNDILPNTVEVFRNARVWSDNRSNRNLSNPFSMRFPLWNPDRFLEKWRSPATRLFTRSGMILWALVVLSALVAAVMHWPELSASLSGRLLMPSNLMLIWITYPLVKILHEFGHAFAVKRWGGEVHEIGILLLAMTPIPYVDATASASFPEKQRRIAVAAAGMMVEILLASLALFVWLNVGSGLVSDVAYNVMLIGGVSTLLFNGNPLLRYDGYYMLADLIEIPNLGQRSTRYLGYLLQRYLMGIKTEESPVTAPGEQGWFLIYGPISFCYRIAVLIGLIWLVSDRFFMLGVLIALWGAVNMLILPFVRSISRFLKQPAIRDRRLRLLLMGGGAVLGTVLLLFALPIPLRTTTQGVVWLPEQSVIRAGTDCEVVEVLVPVEKSVAKDTPLISGADPFLQTELRIHRAHLKELFATYHAQPFHERVKRKILLEEIDLVKLKLHQSENKIQKLTIKSPAQGNFVLIDPRNLRGRFVKKGEMLGYIVPDYCPTIRAVITQSDIGLVRERVTGVEVRLAETPAASSRADIKRIVPAADLNLPSAALGTASGGMIPVDPTDPEGVRALESFFQLDLDMLEGVKDPHIGGRVYVRFEHGSMPIALQWYRSLLQLFLRKFYV